MSHGALFAAASLLTLWGLVCSPLSAQNIEVADPYVPGPDSLPHPDVPKGKVFEFDFNQSRIFPGTTRKIFVYVPAQYRGDKPACVYVGLDGFAFEAPIVFDNLIHKREMPITIGIGITSGTVESTRQGENPRYNRSMEFDGLNDKLARFILEEVLPEVESRKTPDGLPILLSKNPNDRAAGGASTGGIGSFTLAWERPDAFRRVFTAIGTFVGMRGGDRYPVLVRKTEPKPIRIFMQDGSNDGLPGFLDEVGDWWMGNQTMQRALQFSGYQVEYVWGIGPHSVKHGTEIFPQAMRWLWKDWPEPVTAGESKNTFLNGILRTGEDWQVVPGNYRGAGALAANSRGEIVFQDPVSEKNWTISGDGQQREYSGIARKYTGLAFGPDGRAYVADATHSRVVVYSSDGKSSTLATNIPAQDVILAQGGSLYVTAWHGDSKPSGDVWLIKPNGEKTRVDSGLNHPSAIALSPDGLWLAVAEKESHWGYSYRIQTDGSLRDKQQFYWFHVPDEADDSGASAWAMDRDGRLYAATRMGVQIFDRNGRVRAILPVPGGEAVGLAFGGDSFDTLYVSNADGKVYRRKLKAPGAPTWATPIKLPQFSPG
jgi:sugar lactone lactonase YvrE/enterochelin esterase-like enzyme